MGVGGLPAQRDAPAGLDRRGVEIGVRQRGGPGGRVVRAGVGRGQVHQHLRALVFDRGDLRERAGGIGLGQAQPVGAHRDAAGRRVDDVVRADEAGDELGARALEDLARAAGLLDAAGLFAARRRMGMLFQFGALFTDLSVFENVAFPLREHTDLSEALIRDVVLMKLNAVGLRGARDLLPSQISGGMARRVALARAIALDPELIMYDEPFAGLDPISLGTTAQLIRQLNDAMGLTSVLVSHDLTATFHLADHVIILGPGVVAAQGTPAEVMASTDPLVHQFVNALPVGPVPFHYPGPDAAQDFGPTAGARR